MTPFPETVSDPLLSIPAPLLLALTFILYVVCVCVTNYLALQSFSVFTLITVCVTNVSLCGGYISSLCPRDRHLFPVHFLGVCVTDYFPYSVWGFGLRPCD